MIAEMLKDKPPWRRRRHGRRDGFLIRFTAFAKIAERAAFGPPFSYLQRSEPA